MQFTFKKKTGITPAPPRHSENIARYYFNRCYIFLQYKWARWMARHTHGLSRRKQFLVWGAFVFAFSGYSGYTTCKSIFSLHTTESIGVGPLKKHIAPLRTHNPDYERNGGIAPALPHKITGYRKMIDSLARSPDTKQLYDSLIRARPGMLDSLEAIEDYYKLNLKLQNYGSYKITKNP